MRNFRWISLLALVAGNTALACPQLAGSYLAPGDQCLTLSQASDCSSATFNWLGEPKAPLTTDGTNQAQCSLYDPSDCYLYSSDYEGQALVIYYDGGPKDSLSKSVYAVATGGLDYGEWSRKNSTAAWTQTDHETWTTQKTCGW